MILFSIQLFLAFSLSGLYLFSFDFVTVGAVLLALLLFVSINVLFLILVVASFIIIAMICQNGNANAIWRHRFLGQCCEFAFEYWLRVKLEVSGLENMPKNNRFVIVSNHVEFTDPMYVIEVFRHYPLGFIAKETLFRVPVVRGVLKFIGSIPLNRSSDRQAAQSIIEGIKAIKNNRPMMIFPEGTRSHSFELSPFKPGSFKLATKSQATIVPVCMYGVHLAMPSFRLKRRIIKLAVLPSMEPSAYEELDTIEISRQIQELIQEKIDQFHKESKKP